jgi:hypothetical protein
MSSIGVGQNGHLAAACGKLRTERSFHAGDSRR